MKRFENCTNKGKNTGNFYVFDGCLNRDWKTEPADEWGTVGGTADQSTRELPICAVQRKLMNVVFVENVKSQFPLSFVF